MKCLIIARQKVFSRQTDWQKMRILPNSVKHSDVTGNRLKWQLGEKKLSNTPSSILHCISQLGEYIGGPCHWVSQNYNTSLPLQKLKTRLERTFSLPTNKMKWNGFFYTIRTSRGWWDQWDDTALETQDSKFEHWRSEVEHATSRSRRFATILNHEWAGKKHFSLKIEG